MWNSLADVIPEGWGGERGRIIFLCDRTWSINTALRKKKELAGNKRCLVLELSDAL